MTPEESAFDARNAERDGRLGEVARAFLRLGVTAFGGPAAHVALMEDELVRRRQWLSRERFLDLLGAANLIPGPSSSELAIYIGFERAGWLGLVVAGACFILPAALLTCAIAFAYVRFGGVPALGAILYGIKPIVIGVVAQALSGMAPKAIKSLPLALLAIAACAASALGTNALVVLVAAGLGSVIAARAAEKTSAPAAFFSGLTGAGALAAAAAPIGLASLAVVFLKIGATVFGSGYVLLAFLREDFVDRLHWMTEAQLLDAVAVGQLTPGPVFTTATFIGYLLAGVPGAIVATIAIFLPGFVLVAATRPLIARVRSSPRAGAFLDGVNVGALALMAVVTVQLAHAALTDVPTILVAAVSLVLLVRFKVSTTWLIAGGALVGLVVRTLAGAR